MTMRITAAIDPATIGDPHGRLAAAVILRAVTDSRQPGPHRASALAFLRDSIALGTWCQIAGVDVSVIQKRLQQRYTGGARAVHEHGPHL